MEVSELNKFKKNYPLIVEKMCDAAIAAGAQILNIYARDDFEVKIKSDESPLTLADSRADKIITEILTDAFPDIPIVSEESHGDLHSKMADMFFLIDPLDGTKEFINRTGEFTVNIAIILKQRAELGVVFVPTTRELYYRDPDGISYLKSTNADASLNDNVKISCRAVDVQNLEVVQSVSHSNPETDAYIAQYNPKNSRSAGSSLKFCLLARGCADLYPRLGRTMEWDTAAAHAILKGAGGNVFCLDTLDELRYGKAGLENPFFIASGPGFSLIPNRAKI